MEALEEPLRAGHVEGVVEALAQGLGHEGEVGLAADGLEQRVGLEALQVRGRPLALVRAGDEQRTHGGVTEARAEERGADQRLAEQHVELLGRDQRGQALGGGRDLARRERQQDAVVDVARLGDQAERPAQLLLEGHAPGAVDLHAEDRVDHRVPAAHFVRERLHDHALIVGDAVEHFARLDEPGPQRASGGRLEAALLARPVHEVWLVEMVRGVAAEAPDGHAELPRARRMLAPPERDGWRHAVGVLDQHAIGAHLHDAPGVRAEEEHVARQAFGHELLVERAHAEIGIGDEHVEEPGVGNRPA